MKNAVIFPPFARDPRSFIVLLWKNQSHFIFGLFSTTGQLPIRHIVNFAF